MSSLSLVSENDRVEAMKDLSGMANGGGGVLIFGVAEDPENQGAIDTEPGDAFYGYNGEPGRTEEFWILDVDGTRRVIEANWSPASPRKDVAEMRAILDSIWIEP